MRTVLSLSIPALLFITTAAAQKPTVGGVVNAASYIQPGLPNYGIAQGSIFVVFGTNMGPATLMQAGFPLPSATGLAGTSVQVTVNNVTVNALMIYTSAGQLAALLPSSTPVGNGMLTVTFNGQRSDPFAVPVVASAFGIFTANQAGSGPAIVQNFVAGATSLPINSLTESANAGQTLILYGTGLGRVDFDEANPARTQDLPLDIMIFVGGKQATITYKGRSSCCAGLDQINFIAPSGVTGCHVPVVVKIGNVVSNFTTISIADSGKVCSDSNGLSSDQLTRLINAGKPVALGSISLSRTSTKFDFGPPLGSISSQTDSGSAVFSRYDFSNFLNAQNNPFSIISFGACSVFSGVGTSAGIVDPIKPVALDAGPVININGPKGAKQLTKIPSIPGIYSATLGGGTGFPGGPAVQPLYLDKGPYTADNGSGGADVGRFTASLMLPDPLVWTNQDSITTVQRAQGVTVTWTGGDPSGFANITGTSIAGTGEKSPFGLFTCTEKISAGQFTVPNVVLLALPPSANLSGVPAGTLSVGSSVSSTFTAPNIDIGLFTSSVSTSKSVAYQ